MVEETGKSSLGEHVATDSSIECNEPVQWAVYLIRTASNQLYCGVTTDVARRFNEHCHSKKGAKFLKGKGPLTLVWSEQVGDKKTAMQLEYRVKKLPKAKKESIVNHTLNVNTLLE